MPVPQLSDSDETESQGKDGEKHEKELRKELGKRIVNWKAVEQLHSLTFAARRDKVSTITGLHAVSNMLQQYPYFEYEKVVSNHCLQTTTSTSPVFCWIWRYSNVNRVYTGPGKS